jgi:YD repeat-containing protein
VRPGDDTPQSTSAGVRERFVPLSGGYCYLILPDGGKVKFQAEQRTSNGRYYYHYWATAIIDPYGLQTTLTYDTIQNYWRRLTTVTEPAGRYLQFTYTGPNNLTVSQVTEFIGGVARRNVSYYYAQNWAGYLYLDHVVYYNDPNLVAHYQWRGANVQTTAIDLLLTADDPMYPGPMKRIAYTYAYDHVAGTCAWAVFGQIWREQYWDGVRGHEGNGPIVTELSVCTNGSTNGPNYRMETRGDGHTRGFTYSTDGYLTSCTDFMNHTAWQGYDAKKYINSVTDARGQSAGDPSHTTNYVNDPITGNVTQIQFPLTPGDTPDQGNTRPTVNYIYTNNYYLASSQDEAHHTPTAITRDPVSNRVTEIDYPDGGYETFAYDANHFYQLSSHRITTGGTETFAYDGYHRKQYYSDPYHNNGNNPSIQYFYDGLDRVSGIHDALNHPTDFQYNNRGQLTVTTLATAPGDNQRHTIINGYNDSGPNAGDGTLVSVTDQLGHVTRYSYDDYRRIKSVTTPDRGGTHTTQYFYDVNGNSNDYRLTDSSITYTMLPSGKTIKTSYDYNRRKSTVIAGYGTPFAATTGYGYDNVGNVTSVVAPNQQNTNQSTQIAYDERNRPSSITDALNRTTSFTYDTAGRKKRVTRPNGQVISYDTFDAMNRVTQQTTTNAGTTKYTYTQAGLVQTMQDPHLVAINSTDTYSYAYDTMGRKHIVTYPAEPNTGIQRTEVFNYDSAGHLYQYTTRGSKTQTFAYDALNRMTDFSWNDGSTPSVHFDYDVASRLIGITDRQANNGAIIATISRGYFNDNLVRYETETITGGVARQVSYTYDSDGNRATLSIPGYSFTYDYTSRNQVKTITDNGSNITSSFWYDKDGNVVQRNPGNGTTSSYTPDALDRITQIVHSLNGTTRTFNYGYYANSDDRKWTQRLGTVQGNVGDVFSYDYND